MSRSLTANVLTHRRYTGSSMLRNLTQALRDIGADHAFALRAAAEAQLYRRHQRELRESYTGAKPQR